MLKECCDGKMKRLAIAEWAHLSSSNVGNFVVNSMEVFQKIIIYKNLSGNE